MSVYLRNILHLLTSKMDIYCTYMQETIEIFDEHPLRLDGRFDDRATGLFSSRLNVNRLEG